MSREAIYAAIFTKLQGAYPWNTSSRILKHWGDVPGIAQPAMFQTQVSESAATVSRQLTRWTLSLKIYVYIHNETLNGTPPSTALNAAADAICAALKPTLAAEVQTLGGLVEYARIEGAIETDEGFLGEQAVALIPITILAVNL